MQDLHTLPKVRDSWSYLYLEHCRVEQDAQAIASYDEKGKVSIPCASLTLLMLGPGTSITHAAIRALAICGCTVLWVGEQGVRCYAQGTGETRSALNLQRQARLWADRTTHLRIVRLMYQMRFPERLDETLTLQQIRGKEGVRVRSKYAEYSQLFNIPWKGRAYQRADWQQSDPINRALSAANSCLYGVCHAAIVSAGYSPGLGFVHVGKQLSFVYDMADLYKMDITVPAAFAAVAMGGPSLESRVRQRCRDLFQERQLLNRVVADLEDLLTVDDSFAGGLTGDVDSDMALPGGLWDPNRGSVAGGVNFGDEEEEE
jgi:CRISPR-associated protein Cas1